MNSIIGNNHLINIALKSESPSQAAKLAAAFGYSKPQIKDVRDAAKIKRDQGLDEFNSQFSPYEDVNVNEALVNYDKLTIQLWLETPYDQRPLNISEYTDVIAIITNELAKVNIKVKVNSKRPLSPFTKSNVAAKYRVTKQS